jgi:tRNA-guanine transglycosylase
LSQPFTFTIHATDGAARAGEIATPRGVVRTPAFMPVGTAATVKAMHPRDVRALGADVVLGNTYHLMLRPGAERVAALGGLHAFMNWPCPILTDSGGFQVMSLAKLRKLDENGVTFQSHIDGSRHVLTPERSMEIQGLLGSDIQMQFDECVKMPCSPQEAERAMRLSLRWAERSRKAFAGKRGNAVFGIAQGANVPALRIESAKALADMDFHGLAIGGLAVGEPQDVMLAMIDVVEPWLPRDKPRYLMGVGTPEDLVEGVAHSIAAQLPANSVDVVVSAAVGGIVLGYECARQLGTLGIFVEKEGGTPTLRRGFAIDPGQRVLIVEDVVTTGLSVREVIDVVRAHGGVVAAVGVIVRRAIVDFGVPTIALLDLPIESYAPEECPQCAANEPLTEPGSRFLR